ncbi:MAG TPA: nitronate monooxygenase, partial [Microbacterium sp.]|nr:nitronate monooxygenase [Microbacterium sp.]
MTSAWRDTALTRMLGIDLPIVLGAFGGASSVALTAAVSNGGGLGSYGLYGYSAERILRTAEELREATSRPFAVNVWLPHREPGERDPEREAVPDDAFRAAAQRLAPLFAEVGLEPPAEPPASYLPGFDEQLAAVLEARPAVLSVVFGVPDEATIDACRGRGIRVVGTATTVDEGVALA